MFDSPRRVFLVVLVYLCLVEGWPQFPSLFGSGEDDTIVSNGGKDYTDHQNPRKRSLSSFEKFSHPIPADQSVTPRGRRDIEVSVKAHSWPTTIISPLCEAWSFLDVSIGKARSSSSTTATEEQDSLAWRYLDVVVEAGCDDFAFDFDSALSTSM